MYHIKDLITEKTRSYNTRQQLLFGWRHLTGSWPILKIDFGQLNITGKDISFYREQIPGQFFMVDGFGPIPCYADIRCLRRYQVIDDSGKPVDIRDWVQERLQVEVTWANLWRTPVNQEKLPKFRREPAGYGRKSHAHCMSGPALLKGSLKELLSTETSFDDDCFEFNLPPIRGRNINKHTAYQYYDSKRRKSSRSWKAQSKAGFQWAKHKHGCTGAQLRKATSNTRQDSIAARCDIEALLSETDILEDIWDWATVA